MDTSNVLTDLVLMMLVNVKLKSVKLVNSFVGMVVVLLIKMNVQLEVLVLLNILPNVLTEHVLRKSSSVMTTFHVHLICPIDVPMVNAEEMKANAQS